MILPGFTFFVDETTGAAKATYREVQNFTLNEYAPEAIVRFLGLELDAPAPAEKVLNVTDYDKLKREAAERMPNFNGQPGQAADKLWALELALDAYGDWENVTFRDFTTTSPTSPATRHPWSAAVAMWPNGFTSASKTANSMA